MLLLGEGGEGEGEGVSRSSGRGGRGRSVEVRVGTLNVGTMTGKGRELADMMERRKVDILCVQERPSGWGVRLGASEVVSNCSTMVWMGGEMV